MSIDEIKEFCGVDIDDVMLNSLKDAVEIYLKNAGVEPDYENELYKVAMKMLILHWYDNREIVGKGSQLPFGFMSIVIQLKN